ncbi:unnamed protein product, partial [Meganyctiphanes norvegica]
SREFVEMCTGQNGTSYADTLVLSVVEDGFGGKKIIFGSNIRNTINNKEMRKQISSPPAYKSAIWEARLYRNNIGQIMGNGMDIIRKVVEELDKRDVKIMQCGIVVFDSQTGANNTSNLDNGMINDDINDSKTNENLVQHSISPRTDSRRRLQPIPGLVIAHEGECNKSMFEIILTESDQSISSTSTPISLSSVRSSPIQSRFGKEHESFNSSSVSNISIFEKSSTPPSFEISDKGNIPINSSDKNTVEIDKSVSSTIGTSSRLKKSLPKLHIKNQVHSVDEWKRPLLSKSPTEPSSVHSISESQISTPSNSTSNDTNNISLTSPKKANIITPQTTIFLPNFRSENIVTSSLSKMYQNPVSLISPNPYKSTKPSNILDGEINDLSASKSVSFPVTETYTSPHIVKNGSPSVSTNVSSTSFAPSDTSSEKNMASSLNSSIISSTPYNSNLYEKLPNKLESSSEYRTESSAIKYTKDLYNENRFNAPIMSKINLDQKDNYCSSGRFEENSSELEISSSNYLENKNRKSTLPTILENFTNKQSVTEGNKSLNSLYKKMPTRLELSINDTKNTLDINTKVRSSLEPSSKIDQEEPLNKTTETYSKTYLPNKLIETSSNSDFNELPSTRKTQSSTTDNKTIDTKSVISTTLPRSPFESDKYKINKYSSPYSSELPSSSKSSLYDTTDLYKKIPTKLDNSSSSSISKYSTSQSPQNNAEEKLSSNHLNNSTQKQQIKNRNIDSIFKSQDHSRELKGNSSLYAKSSDTLTYSDKEEDSVPPGERSSKDAPITLTPQK